MSYAVIRIESTKYTGTYRRASSKEARGFLVALLKSVWDDIELDTSQEDLEELQEAINALHNQDHLQSLTFSISGLAFGYNVY